MKECFIALREVCLHVVTIDVDGVAWRDLGRMRRDASQYSLELQGVLDGDGLRKRYWGEGDGRKGRPAGRPKSARLTVSTVRIPAV